MTQAHRTKQALGKTLLAPATILRNSLEQKIFKQGSTTYYFSSRFFPPEVRAEVFRLYSFVRVADDYVDAMPAQADKFASLRARWNDVKTANFEPLVTSDDSLDERVIKNMLFVLRKHQLEPEWVETFLNAMQADLDGRQYHTLNDTITYMYGSAEVIGLMMAKIMGLPNEALPFAQMQGRAMQYINFIRDIEEDNRLGRSYFPQDELKKFGLPDVAHRTAQAKPEEFCSFIHAQLERYNGWQTEAEQGFSFIPRRLLIPLQTAADMYNWTAKQIAQDPLQIFERKIKPQKRQVIRRAIRNSIII